MLSAGSRVRVLGESCSRRAMVCCVDEDTLEVLYDGGDDEATVSRSVCQPLEAFELASGEQEDPEPAAAAARLKAQGTVLFKLKDYQAAAERYNQAIASLRTPLSAGAVALVKPEGRATRSRPLGVRPAVVLCAEESSADLQFLDDETEQDGMPAGRLIVLDRQQLPLLVALYMNLVRCFLNLDAPEYSVQYCSRARGVAVAMRADGAEQADEQIVVSWFLEARSHMAAHMRKLAMEACEQALLLDPSNKGVQTLVKQIQRSKDKRIKSNKKIAREVSKWIESTMGDANVAGALAEGGL